MHSRPIPAGFDPIAAVETMYRPHLEGAEWLSSVMDALWPLLDRSDKGLIGGCYVAPDPTEFCSTLLLAPTTGAREMAVFNDATVTMPPEFVADVLLSNRVSTVRTAAGFGVMGPVRTGAFTRAGIADSLVLAAAEPGGSGCMVQSMQSEPVALGHTERRVLARLRAHLAAAHRLRRIRGGVSPSDAQAVLDPSGALQAASAAAAEPLTRLALRDAVRRLETARGPRRWDEPIAALASWETLACGRYTLLDHFEENGRRYILAVANVAPQPGESSLTPRERIVAQLAARGLHNKGIAYELGLANSTVRVLMARAAAKLGVRTRAELVRHFRGNDASEP